MAAKLLIVLDSPDEALLSGSSTGGYGTGAVIQLERAGDSSFGTPTAVAEIPVVAGQYAYVYWDNGGTSYSWYRWRLEDSSDTETGEWSEAFQGWDPATGARRSGAYATPDRLQLRAPRPNERATDRLARFELALLEARERIDDMLGVQGLFFRSPQTGADEARVFDARGDTVIHVHNGIVELAGIRIKRSPTSSWETITATDARLEYWADTGSAHTAPDGEPYDHVVLTGAGALTSWPSGRASVELTGAFNWPRIPRRAANANIEWARQALAADASYPGGTVGPQELGRPMGPNRMPDAVYRLAQSFSRRFWCQL